MLDLSTIFIKVNNHDYATTKTDWKSINPNISWGLYDNQENNPRRCQNVMSSCQRVINRLHMTSFEENEIRWRVRKRFDYEWIMEYLRYGDRVRRKLSWQRKMARGCSHRFLLNPVDLDTGCHPVSRDKITRREMIGRSLVHSFHIEVQHRDLSM